MHPATPEQLGQVETEYHRLYRAHPDYRWWRPLLLMCLVGVFALLSSGVVMAIALGVIGAVRGEPVDPWEIEGLFIPDTQNPVTMLLGLGSIAVWLPCVFFAMWCVGIKPAGRLSSVAFRLRWGLIARLILPGLAALLAVQAVSIGVGLLLPSEGPAPEVVPVEMGTALASVLIILLIVPVQAAAEEYVFRGVLMQAIGSWLRNPALAIILPTLLFMSQHIYDVWGLLQVGLMGATAAWLAWRTGGLEAAIVIHVLNNIVSMLIMTTGLTGQTGQTAETGGPLSVLVVAVMLAVYAWLAMRVFTRGGYGRTLLVVPAPAAQLPSAPAPLWTGTPG
ncbi:CPBP family intramembrane glutamic endopeptidase, partial [Leucobacter sp. M11]|uniref:CPBP family intramembrane glutamic endopeptidase n=1 Tax=Leucobacter sp. M11 TaxID=2993565 RepID=UPI002D7F293F